MKEQVEQILGYKLEMLDYSQLTDLNAVPVELINEARKLSLNAHKIYFLKQYFQKDEHKYLQSFIDDLVVGGETPATWLKGGFLAIDCTLKEQLTLSKKVILAEIGTPFFFRKKPNFNSWKQGASIGAPARLDLSLNYRSQLAPNTIRLPLNYDLVESVAPEQNDDVYIQWILQRIARYLLSRNSLQYLVNTEAFEDIIGIENWSNEAILALNSLNQELKEGGHTEGYIPGFRNNKVTL